MCARLDKRDCPPCIGCRGRTELYNSLAASMEALRITLKQLSDIIGPSPAVHRAYILGEDLQKEVCCVVVSESLYDVLILMEDGQAFWTKALGRSHLEAMKRGYEEYMADHVLRSLKITEIKAKDIRTCKVFSYQGKDIKLIFVESTE